MVPLSQQVVELLKPYRKTMQCLRLNTKDAFVFVTPRTTLGYLYDSGLEKGWKRSQRCVGLAPRRLYAQRHSFLSHALALGNSPADLAVVAGHRTEEMLRTYAKPNGRVKVPTW